MNKSLSGISTTTTLAFTPEAFLTNSITLTNHAGRVVDIKSVVTDFTVTESIYMTAVGISLNIKDEVNMFEEMQLIGQEIITIDLVREDNLAAATRKTIKLTFYVAEYPLYGRMSDRLHLQVYTITGISKHAYVSQFKSLSRAITGSTVSQIQKILINDLDVPAKTITVIGDPISQFQGIIPTMKPMDAIEWLRRRTYDKDGSPFYVFESVTGGIIIQSLSSMVKEKTNPLYATYTDSKTYDSEAISHEEYAQKAGCILEASSSIKMSKILSARSGAYASNNHYLDMSTKSYVVKIFDYDKHFNIQNTLENKSILSTKFKIKQFGINSEPVPLNKMWDASDSFIPLNILSYSADATVNNYQGMCRDHHDKNNAFTENLDTYIHDLHLFGDYTLNAGRRVKLRFPRAKDPTAERNDTDRINDAKVFDNTFTGFYLVTSVVHKFSTGDGYFCDIRVKRDSLSFNLVYEQV